MDAHSCIHQCSRRAGCITKGARPVRRAGIRIRRQRCRTALMLDPTGLFHHWRWQTMRSVHYYGRAQPLSDSLPDCFSYRSQPGPSHLRSSHARIRGTCTDKDRQWRTVCRHRATGAVKTLSWLDEARYCARTHSSRQTATKWSARANASHPEGGHD